MFRFAPYVFKTMWRHRTRTMLTVSGVAVGLFVFCCIGSAQRGMARLTEDQQAQRTLVVFQENRFCPASSRLPEDYAAFIAEQPGVKDVMPIKVFTNNCRASLDAIVFQGMPPAKIREFRDVQLASGDWGQFERSNDAALVGKAVAQRRRLKLGDKFTIGEVTILVAGTFSSPVAAEENYIYTHLDFLQRARGKTEVGIVTQFELRLAEGADPKHVAQAIDTQYRRGPVATTTRTKGAFQAETLGDLVEIIGLIHYLGYACVGLVLSLVATTTVMSVQDRIKEHGVLQTIGLRPGQVFGLVVAESLILSVAGGILGLGAGLLLLGFGRLAVGAEGVAIAFRPSLDLAITGGVVAAVAGILAGLAPAWQAARTEIVAALRHA
jgi:putative ABC transport system permease protein